MDVCVYLNEVLRAFLASCCFHSHYQGFQHSLGSIKVLPLLALLKGRLFITP